jgi:hypothetical protein
MACLKNLVWTVADSLDSRDNLKLSALTHSTAA